ncbi:radical SAM family heme chaperone HemW [Sphingobacterium faecale]|uniref:Heme chaperone HemW n=1 Tax=Sphingobacterium faecale TaxID=2803775 RepID=A0ABS1R513_9SPHI|nr:radical SAM family heme chaperone HemW [Sphingobacterium faecale]MBL1409649.1 radical SAM family heme chaperone HemW [Sphingobacterium faecale]
MIYFHIPFCKQACHYCDFHFTTSLKYKEDLLLALHKELAARSHYIEDRRIHSIYFGGGTPSILEASEIQQIIDQVARHFDIDSQAEITMEANPDDLTSEKTNALRQTSINRFSIGIQSFFEEDLLWMNRAHNAQEADTAIKRVQDAGFENITCDLIYGYPLLSNEKWSSNINKLIQLEVPHISSYAMTVEQRTALAHQIKSGKTPAILDEQAEVQMQMLMETLTSHGYEHYEISNFAKNGSYAIHNTNYWKGKHYLGIGPSAHSYNGVSRSWNIANNAKYMAALQDNTSYQEVEQLSLIDSYNEYIMTSLRTMWGVELREIEERFGTDLQSHFLREITLFVEQQKVQSEPNGSYKLTREGKLFADFIASELFFIPK